MFIATKCFNLFRTSFCSHSVPLSFNRMVAQKKKILTLILGKAESGVKFFG